MVHMVCPCGVHTLRALCIVIYLLQSNISAIMNLLPKSHEEFSTVDYWNTFFKKRGKKAFEWYGEFLELSTYILKYIKSKDNILIVGCGNSSLGMDLYDAGYKNVKNIDVSSVVINQMQEINKTQRPDLIFEQMDATQMTYNDETFSVVLDKGTLDALMSDNNEETITLMNQYHKEIKRVLKNSGRYICISLLEEHILRTLITNFSSSFAFRVIRCHDAEIKAKENNQNSMPVFIVVSTKFIKLPQQILEIVLTDDPPVRLSNTEEVVNNIISTQQSASLCNSLYKGSVANDGEVSLDLYKPGHKEPRYTIYILDQLLVKERKSYAVFIVPQGREMDWLFSTKKGRQELLKSTEHDRLAIVILRRGQDFESLDAIKNELADSVKNFAPSKLSKSQIPFLSLGKDIGKRKICYKGKSEISGPYIVEETETENGIYRRLVFLNNQFIVQSEAKLKQVMSRRKKTKYVVDTTFAACDHHILMSVGLEDSLKSQYSKETLIIGLGGGGLCTFIRQYIPQAKLIAVEIDKEMLMVATEYFDLKQDENFEVIISDGIKYLEKSAMENKKFSAILFDVDNKDASIGMSGPPKQFVELDFLKIIRDCLLDEGFFILNLVARNKKLRDQTIDDLKKVFNFVATYKVLEDLNEIIFSSKISLDFSTWKRGVQKSAKNLNEQAKMKNPSSDELFKLSFLLNGLKIAE